MKPDIEGACDESPMRVRVERRTGNERKMSTGVEEPARVTGRLRGRGFIKPEGRGTLDDL